MEENRQDILQTENTENKETAAADTEGASRQTVFTQRQTGRHTWIGDKDEIAPGSVDMRTTRATTFVPDINERQTKIVEKQRKAYRGFITDEEVRDAETQAEIDRAAREKERTERAARQELAQTRIYTGFGSGMDEEEKPAAEKRKPSLTKRTFTVNVSDSRKFRRLIPVAVVLVLILAFEIGFAAMKMSIRSLPDKTKEVKNQTEQLLEKNEELQQRSDALGDIEQIKELRDSWQRLNERLTE